MQNSQNLQLSQFSKPTVILMPPSLPHNLWEIISSFTLWDILYL